MKIWFDTEFIEDGLTIDLISIGMVSEDGREYYAEFAECDHSRADSWVRDNVLVHLTGEIKFRDQIKRDILAFCGPSPEVWAYYADYDWVALCQLFGRMIDLPNGWPMYCYDLKQLADSLGAALPEQEGIQHNALEDARAVRLGWMSLQPENDFKRRINASWTFAEMLSDDEDVRKAAIVHSLETGAELWRTGCRCNKCRDAYLKVVRSLVGE